MRLIMWQVWEIFSQRSTAEESILRKKMQFVLLTAKQMGKGKCRKPSFTLFMISPQLCSVHTCVLIWSPPTHLSMRAPPWGPSPPPPSLSTWTTEQRRGTASTCLFALFCSRFTSWHRDWLLISSLSPWCKAAAQTEGLWICHTQCKHTLAHVSITCALTSHGLIGGGCHGTRGSAGSAT